jgi:hypothetical protein
MPSMSFRIARCLFHLALAVDGDDLGIRVEFAHLGRAEIEHGPARGVVHWPAERLCKARPGQADLHHGVLEMARREAGRAERAVLLLRVLQDQHRNAVLDRHDAVADAQRDGLAAKRALGDRFSDFGLFRHAPAIRFAAG